MTVEPKQQRDGPGSDEPGEEVDASFDDSFGPGDPLEAEAAELFFDHMAARETGRAIDIEPLCRARPDLAPLLRAQLEDFLSIKGDLGGGGADGVDLAKVLSDRGEDGALGTQSLGPIGAAGPRPDGDGVDAPLEGPESFDSRYRTEGRVDRGAMGEILRVWDQRLNRYLAMKVMKAREVAPDDEAGRQKALAAAYRFHGEAQVTAQLDHPGIVPVHDLGMDAEGRMYFTMKYVKGRRNLKVVFDMVRRGQDGWSINRAVGTILRVCEAVAYAHSKGVLHRDIKPANIMVGQFGETYLLDWGLARRVDEPVRGVVSDGAGGADPDAGAGRDPVGHDGAAVHDETRGEVLESWLFSRDGDVLGTPPYMSPEQARGEVERVDERSDVYSLGALLYHLLTGLPPYIGEGETPFPFMVIARVRREPPRSVRELAPDAPPGLVAICERAMSRHREERYASAADMAHDLEDYLEDISEAREEARRQADRATAINSFLVRMLSSADPRQAQGRDVTVLEVLDRFSGQLGSELDALPVDEAGLRRTIGNVYKELGRHEVAREHLERSMTLYEQVLGTDHGDTLQAATDLAMLDVIMGRHDLGRRLLEEVLEVQQRVLGDDAADTLRTMVGLAEVLRISRVDLDRADALLTAVVAARETRLGREHFDTLVAMNRLGMVRWHRHGRDDDGAIEALLRESRLGLLARVGSHHPEALMAMSDLSNVLQQKGRLDEAEELARTTLTRQRDVLGVDHPESIVSLANLGWLCVLKGAYDEAEALLLEAVERQGRVAGPAGRDAVIYRNNLAKLYLLAGRVGEALALFRALLPDAERAHDGKGWHLGRIRCNFGVCLARSGLPDEAREVLTRALAELTAGLGPDHELVREAREALDGLGHPPGA